jgi:hypothetical protein
VTTAPADIAFVTLGAIPVVAGHVPDKQYVAFAATAPTVGVGGLDIVTVTVDTLEVTPSGPFAV